VVTWLNRGDSIADHFNDAGTLVAEHSWQRKRQVASASADISVADRGSDYSNQHFIGTRLV
jgi:hypothetical protein